MKIGDTFRDRLYKYHVITILDKEPYTQIVLKYYGRWKQYWHYEVRSLFDIQERLKCGLFDTYKESKK